jgi:hypothetical protein
MAHVLSGKLIPSLHFTDHISIPHLLGYEDAFLQSDCAHISSTSVALKLLAFLDL